MTDGVLVVGYGNPLRTDDGLGWHAAQLLTDDPRLDGVVVLQRHQLTPELALDVSTATLVVLVDASHGPPAGKFTVARVEPASGARLTWSHHLSPTGLVALAHQLYGRVPDVFLVSGGTESLEVGDRLSPVVEDALPRVVDAVADLVASRCAPLPPPSTSCGARPRWTGTAASSTVLSSAGSGRDGEQVRAPERSDRSATRSGSVTTRDEGP